jgi:hypothetical protein
MPRITVVEWIRKSLDLSLGEWSPPLDAAKLHLAIRKSISYASTEGPATALNSVLPWVEVLKELQVDFDALRKVLFAKTDWQEEFLKRVIDAAISHAAQTTHSAPARMPLALENADEIVAE